MAPSVAGLASFYESFEWRRGVTPLSEPSAAGALVLAYLFVVYHLKQLVRHWRGAGHTGKVPLGFLPALHNAVLCLGSAAMFAGALYEGVRHHGSQAGGAGWLVCLAPGTEVRGPLWFWSYVYYLSKYYEFIDTLLIVLKERPLSFLHVFHHSVVVPMAWMWLEHAQSLQLIALLTNTGIHVIMYAYYFLTSLGISPGWKVLVTNGQIVQFVFSFTASVPFVYKHFTTEAGCSGFNAWCFNCAFNAALLYLFADFHRKTYREKKAAKQKAS